MKTYTAEQLVARLKSLGHVVFENDAKDLNLNIIGVRASDPVFNKFNDQLYLIWKFKGKWELRRYEEFTTLPGERYMKVKLLNPSGCAILVPGQYRGAYKLDLHNGKYQALCQRLGEVKVYRDKNRDSSWDFDNNTISEGYYGINIHNSPDGGRTYNIGAYSAGCQVFSKDEDFYAAREIWRKAADIHGNKFTYTLITEFKP